MKPTKIALRLALTLLFIVLSVYYLYPTYRYSKLQEKQLQEVDALAQMTQASQIEILRAVTEGREADVFSYAEQTQDSSVSAVKTASDKAHYLMSELAEKLDKNRRKSLKLGLDLQGGVHLVLEVDLVTLMKQLANNPDARFDTLMTRIAQRLLNPNADFNEVVLEEFEKADVQLSRYFGETAASNRQVLGYLSDQADDAITRSLEIMRNRIDQFGVSEPSIVRQGNRRIVIELPGVQDPNRARELIGKTALLEFKLLLEPAAIQKVLEDIDNTLKRSQGKLPLDTLVAAAGEGEQPPTSAAAEQAPTQQADTAKVDTAAAPIAQDSVLEASKLFSDLGEKTALGEDTSLVIAAGMEKEHPFYALLRALDDEIAVVKQNRRAIELILAKPEIRAVIPKEVELLWSNSLVPGPDGKEYWHLYVVKSQAEITGKYLTKADVQIGSDSQTPGREGQPIVSLAMNREGARIFSRVTGANVNKKLAIVLDQHVYMAPVIKVKIPDGRAIIEGSDTMEKARDLAIVLRAGALPAPVEIIEEQIVGPSLGSDSIIKGRLAAILSFIVIAMFMLWYYRFAGLIADIALSLNLIFLVAILAGFQATLTMPGIAGLVLTIGMAVDANVLIYERIREELRTGKTVRASIDAGYARATVTILDSNITTIIAAIVLYQFGTGSIKGFALTLFIGIGVSLFTAIIVSRLIFDMYTQKFLPTRLNI